MRNQILFLLFILFLVSAAQAEPHHCHDQATNKQWKQIRWNHRGEKDVEALYALRVRLCRQVDAGYFCPTPRKGKKSLRLEI
jgi:hypothetical protein